MQTDGATWNNNPMNESGGREYPSPDFQDEVVSGGKENGALDGGDSTEEDPEHSRWIHKDKLERMEHEEMERLGIRIPRSRAGSRSNGGRSKSRDPQNRAEQIGQHKRQKVETTPREEEEEQDWDLRLPEERDALNPYWEQATGSKLVSRIPVCKTSPMPIPIEHIERDTPMQYSKTTGLVGADDSISYAKSRGRSGSIKLLGNENVPDSAGASSRVTSGRRVATEISPPKKTSPRKISAPTSGTTSNQQRTKARSGSNGTRPVTRSGELGSGSVSRRPEGDPPWLATMYKPDPRLPPDQQILPTHAKRMQQEQWERDGKFGTTYDTEFRPLNSEDWAEREQPVATSPTPEIEMAKSKTQSPELQTGWPLQSPKSPTLSTGRPGTAGGGGSYSTMPKISSPRSYASPMPSPSVTQIASTFRVPEPPVEEKETEDKKEAGCACCIVM